jgi:hypothetical protein
MRFHVVEAVELGGTAIFIGRCQWWRSFFRRGSAASAGDLGQRGVSLRWSDEVNYDG